MSRRTARVASLIRRIVAEMIQVELADPRLPPLTSVTRTEVTSDLSLATIHVSVLSERTNAGPRAIEALEAAAGRIRARLAAELTIRKAPALRFRLDESVQRAFETVQVIEALNRQREAAQQGAPAPGEGSQNRQDQRPEDE